ncbi:uncharacterized protein LOC133203995 [Saccostrea echinata]|uniref:uncharacterized protein LOC133203995 n=1 Tax=Saccostrea echinata TaxID=191078 RepID=UPI002A7F681E|nr:uncharacterized protein LOC133203995 [Saccostrea echinata]
MECSTGLTGPNYSLQCRYPSYGRLCQQQCDCTEIYCNKIVGCISVEKGVIKVICSVNLNMYLRKIVLFSVTFIYHIRAAKGDCNPDHENNCCQGFFFDEISNECKECPVGYMGLNCFMECRYPGYGKSCQEECNCSEELCDISTGCIDSPKNEEILPDKNSTESRQESKNSNMEPPVAPILIGVIAFMTFLVLAIGGRIIWKKVKQSNSRMVQGRQEIQRLEKQLNRKNDENEGTKENLYEDMDGQNTEESGKEDLLSSENDYIDKLAYLKKENKSDNRESNHFYDALK